MQLTVPTAANKTLSRVLGTKRCTIWQDLAILVQQQQKVINCRFRTYIMNTLCYLTESDSDERKKEDEARASKDS